MNAYIKINASEVESVENLLYENSVEFETKFDPMVYLCEELVEAYIENNVEEELKLLFVEAKEDVVDYLYEEACNTIDGNFVIDVLTDFTIDMVEDNE